MAHALVLARPLRPRKRRPRGTAAVASPFDLPLMKIKSAGLGLAYDGIRESRSATMNDSGYILIVGAFFLYWVPMIVSISRRHRSRLAIFVLNALLGWTVLGWIAALVWACTNDVEPPESLAHPAGPLRLPPDRDRNPTASTSSRNRSVST